MDKNDRIHADNDRMRVLADIFHVLTRYFCLSTCIYTTTLYIEGISTAARRYNEGQEWINLGICIYGGLAFWSNRLEYITKYELKQRGGEGQCTSRPKTGGRLSYINRFQSTCRKVLWACGTCFRKLWTSSLDMSNLLDNHWPGGCNQLRSVNRLAVCRIGDCERITKVSGVWSYDATIFVVLLC